MSSDGTTTANPKAGEQVRKKISYYQAKLGKAHARAANIPRDTIQKASHHAATTHAVNIVEDLDVDAMGRKGRGKRGFNRAAKDAVLAELRRELSWKCPWYGSSLWLAGLWHPSSKTCSRCSRATGTDWCPSVRGGLMRTRPKAAHLEHQVCIHGVSGLPRERFADVLGNGATGRVVKRRPIGGELRRRRGMA